MVASKGKKNGSGSALPQFNAGDLVLAKLPGYPFWPGMVVDTAPTNVMKQKRGANQKIIRFIPDSNYGFLGGRELKPLSRDDIETYINDKTHTKGDLLEAYKTALNPDAWQREADELERQAEQAALEAAENEDELDDDADKPASKKRKSSSGGSTKASASSKKSSSSGAKKASKAGESKKAETGKKRKADGSGAGSGKDDDKDDGAELGPASKKVKGWRHELQRNFLGKDGVLKDSMDKSGEVFETLEAYTDMTQKQLQDSKILKVLKKIIGLKDGEIPADAESKYNFKSRADKLYSKWADTLASGNSSSAAPSAPTAPIADGAEQDKEAAAAEGSKESEKAAVVPNGDAAPASARAEDKSEAETLAPAAAA
ncbi:hypothetical protein K437DRAFT_254839 [Tilletiaria anomala UBC 951]|uniref:PWWP domain-containing protein n=1 Tax=Tilletiaria anomala (strain ATCC 24038 / CBS 436.72 / UBC 951) TaxID=1037660 RepID=A0A066WBW9_TILAU|nr:uncharacterized protein K437DRAFT_254839 [Tilletiaria anomala UBC 951]KDN51427.1 hypothetical protein K437DRAFT_254839 [Tilletiaria anomala UBC 951]